MSYFLMQIVQKPGLLHFPASRNQACLIPGNCRIQGYTYLEKPDFTNKNQRKMGCTGTQIFLSARMINLRYSLLLRIITATLYLNFIKLGLQYTR